MRIRLLLVTVVLVAAAAGAAAQDYIFTNFAASRDLPVPQAPCVIQGAAQPVVYDSSLWVFYTCTDNHVIARRFIHPNDRADWMYPKPVIVITPTPTPPPPAPPASGCPGDFVRGRLGGCVPSNHPLAVR